MLCSLLQPYAVYFRQHRKAYATSAWVLREYALAVKDEEGRNWDIVVKSWDDETGNRRVYRLTQISFFIRSNCLREGDVLGLCRNEAGDLLIAANTPELREATLRPLQGIARQHPCS